MATSRTPLEGSPLDRALSRAATTYDPDADEGTVEANEDELIGGHPAQETEFEEDEADEDDDLDEDSGEEEELPSRSPERPTRTPAPEQPDQRQQDADRRVQLATEEAAHERREREAVQARAVTLEAEIAGLKAKVDAAPEPKEGQRQRPDITQAKQQMKAKLQELGKLEASHPEYWDGLANGWHDALEPVITAVAHQVFGELTQGQLGAITEKIKAELLNEVRSQVLPAWQQERDQLAEKDRTYTYIVGKVKDAGFNVDADRGTSEEADEFWDFVIPYVDKVMPEGTLDAKITKAIDVFQRHRGAAPAKPQPTPAPQERRRPRPQQPMGRNGQGRPVATEDEDEDSLLSLDNVIERTHGKRRV